MLLNLGAASIILCVRTYIISLIIFSIRAFGYFEKEVEFASLHKIFTIVTAFFLFGMLIKKLKNLWEMLERYPDVTSAFYFDIDMLHFQFLHPRHPHARRPNQPVLVAAHDDDRHVLDFLEVMI